VSDLPVPDLIPRLQAFVDFRAQYLTGDERGQAQIFCDRLFTAFGHAGLHEAGASLEYRLKKQDSKGTAFADLMWKPRCLIEMKKSGTDLTKHYRQAFDYWVQAVPDRPRYVVLCNFDEFLIYDFDLQLDAPMDTVRVDELPGRFEALSFLLPQEQAPIFRHNLVGVTREAAADVARVFKGLVARGADRAAAQRFVLQAVMAMFSEDIGLLPGAYFSRAVEDCLDASGDPYDLIFGLFREMNLPGATAGGRFKGTPYFNGGLFADISPLDLTREDLNALQMASQTNWSFVRPEIFGTLFEGSMDQGERHATGAHFTSQADIMKVVGPTIVEPWRAKIAEAGSIPALERLLGEMFNFRVLDPACGSGNFLYVAYREMRRLEAEALHQIDERRTSRDIAAQRAIAYVSPDHFYGIDVNNFAVEVAKVTMMLAKKLSADELDASQDVLPLDSLDETIVAADALFCPWPRADAIIGNPPYLGRRKMLDELGADYSRRLAQRHPNVGGVSDFVCYWFPLAHDHLKNGGRAGYVATNSVRQNESREVSLDYVADHGGTITEAVSTQPWSGDAVVHVSIVNWTKGPDEREKILWLNDGQLRLPVPAIPTSLKPDVDVRTAVALSVNTTPPKCFQGQTPGVTEGFVLTAEDRQALLAHKDGSVFFIHPFLGGREMINKVDIDRWIVDLPHTEALLAHEAASAAFRHLERLVLPAREDAAKKEQQRNADILTANGAAKVNRHHANFLNYWWRLGYRREDMLDAFQGLDRYIATSRVQSLDRLPIFSFVDVTVRPGDSMTVFALDDDYSFGVLSSSIHRAWLLARCSTLKADPRYTSTTVWDSFPWPQTPSSSQVAAVVSAVSSVMALRQGYFQQGIPLKRQYNALRVPGRAPLRDAHEALHEAVADLYGFNPDDPLLAQLLALNLELSSKPSSEVRGAGAAGLEGARRTDFRLLGPSAV
jgi:hypothetical protein